MVSPKPLRADAARKREQIVAAARDELADLADTARNGAPGKLTLDRVATRAGVGIATLYRHFPTREALVEEVYRQELDRLCAAAPALAAQGPADAALLAWMARYVDWVESKRAMGESLRTLVASGAVTRVETRSRLAQAVMFFLAAGKADGTLRDDVPAEDVVAAMAAALLAGADGREQTARLHTLLLDGLRRRP